MSAAYEIVSNLEEALPFPPPTHVAQQQQQAPRVNLRCIKPYQKLLNFAKHWRQSATVKAVFKARQITTSGTTSLEDRWRTLMTPPAD